MMQKTSLLMISLSGRPPVYLHEQYMLRNAAKKILVKENLQETWSNFVELKEQGAIITCLTETYVTKRVKRLLKCGTKLSPECPAI